MAATGPRLPREEIARRGDELYTGTIRPTLRPEDDGKFVAIDVETGAFEVDADDYTAVARLRQRVPGAQSWLMRVGHPAAHKLLGMALRLGDPLPDDATWEDLLYQVYVRQSIDAGLEDCREGRLVSTDEVRRRLGLPK